MEAKFTRLTHKIAIQLVLVAESCNICSSRSRRQVQKFLVTSSQACFVDDKPFSGKVLEIYGGLVNIVSMQLKVGVPVML